VTGDEQSEARGWNWTVALWVASLTASFGSYLSVTTMAFVRDGPGVPVGGPFLAIGGVAWVGGLVSFLVCAARCRKAGHIALSLGAGMGQFFLLLSSGLIPRFARHDFLERCDRGEAPACYAAAGIFRNGFFIPKDIERGRALDQRSCEGGHYLACLRLLRDDPGAPKEPVCAAVSRGCKKSTGPRDWQARNLCELEEKHCTAAR
jgi:hypothetical protein